MNDRVINAIKEWLKVRPTDRGDKLFVSRQGEKISRSRINQIFNKYSDIITPHQLRHFGCTYLYSIGFTLIEIASMARTFKYINYRIICKSYSKRND